ncbi:AcrR family transcriptional regulator [Rhizobium leguminosarum]
MPVDACVYSLVGIHSDMISQPIPTRERIISAAAKLFYNEGIRSVSVDAVAEEAGVTKRTLYYHFASKDDLIGAYLEARDQPNLSLFKRWYAETTGEPADKVQGIFRNLARAARHPKWKGCGFLRTSAELANMPGHPAMKVGIEHKKRVEAWFAGYVRGGRNQDGSAAARSADRPAARWLVRRRSVASRPDLYGSRRRGGWFADPRCDRKRLRRAVPEALALKATSSALGLAVRSPNEKA